MRRRVAILLCLAGLGVAAAPTWAEEVRVSCVTHCHGEESRAFEESVHAKTLGCTDCHGGDPTAQRDKEASHSAAANFRGRVPREAIPDLCSSCHADPVRMHRHGLPTDQRAHYERSAHGRAVLERGDVKAAVCTDCHGSHAIRRANDPLSPSAAANQPATCGACHSDAEAMAPYGLATDVVERFVASVHGEALLRNRTRGAPTCSSCHGAHAASPPGVADIVDVCSHCHASTADHYRTSPHFQSEDMSCRACHEEEGTEFRRSGCAACHGAHDIASADLDLYAGDAPGHCDHCHRDGDAAVDRVRDAILSGRAAVKQGMEDTQALIEQGKARGLFLENEKLYVRESALTLVSYRPLAHGLDADALENHLDLGLRRQDRTREMLEKKSAVSRDRRIVILAFSFILLLFAALLWVKLQAIRRLS